MRRKLLYARYLLPVLVVLALTACGPKKPTPTPTMSVDAIYTAAFQTLTSQQATQLAQMPPTATSTNTPFPTLLAAPTLASGSPFGTATTSVGGGGRQGCDSSAYVADVTIPDGTVLTPGKKFAKTWTVMNNGTCDWSMSYKLVPVGGDAMGGAAVPVPAAVPAGQQINISVALTAPTAAGDYTGSWQLQNAAGQNFGNIITVVIKVGAAEVTNTPGTPAASQTPSNTPTTPNP